MIQRYLQDPLAEAILAGKISDGQEVEIGVGVDGLTINGESGYGDGRGFGHRPEAPESRSQTVH